MPTKHRILRYKVTQPRIYSKSIAEYPEFTTRVGSNERFILAANHPEWYEAARAHEQGMLETLTVERLRQDFRLALHSKIATTPIHAYGLVLLQRLNDYVAAELNNEPQLRQIFNNAVHTVISNLTQLIFQDPAMLDGRDYRPSDIQRWRENLSVYLGEDVFTYRPGEKGRDMDGRVKPILEVCPAPKLARDLMANGTTILIDYIKTERMLIT